MSNASEPSAAVFAARGRGVAAGSGAGRTSTGMDVVGDSVESSVSQTELSSGVGLVLRDGMVVLSFLCYRILHTGSACVQWGFTCCRVWVRV